MTELEQAIKKMTDGYDGWESHAKEATKRIIEICTNYATYFGSTPLRMFEVLEERRDYSYPNYYQEANFPALDSSVAMYATIDDAKAAMQPDKGFVCCACEKVSKSPTNCTNEPCSWKSYGFLGTAGKGHRFVIKDTFMQSPVVHEIFMPLVLSQQKDTAKEA